MEFSLLQIIRNIETKAFISEPNEDLLKSLESLGLWVLDDELPDISRVSQFEVNYQEKNYSVIVFASRVAEAHLSDLIILGIEHGNIQNLFLAGYHQGVEMNSNENWEITHNTFQFGDNSETLQKVVDYLLRSDIASNIVLQESYCYDLKPDDSIQELSEIKALNARLSLTSENYFDVLEAENKRYVIYVKKLENQEKVCCVLQIDNNNDLRPIILPVALILGLRKRYVKSERPEEEAVYINDMTVIGFSGLQDFDFAGLLRLLKIKP